MRTGPDRVPPRGSEIALLWAISKVPTGATWSAMDPRGLVRCGTDPPNTRSGRRLALVNCLGARRSEADGGGSGVVRPSKNPDDEPVLVRAEGGDSGACQLIGLTPSD
jgi:hypothetical protein